MASSWSDDEDDSNSPLPDSFRSKYTLLNFIEEGSFGEVYRAEDKSTKDIVAVKSFKVDHEVATEGFPASVLREINILRSYPHSNIVALRDVVPNFKKNRIAAILEYAETDSRTLMRFRKRPFGELETKLLMQQLLSAIAHLHAHGFVHRDVKPSNLLINAAGRLKLADFGLARRIRRTSAALAIDAAGPNMCDSNLTPLVVTVSYRSPELLLGEQNYGFSIDMWSVGCVMGEFLTGRQLFCGSGELQVLSKIFDVVGTPTEKNWPGYDLLAYSRMFQWKERPSAIADLFCTSDECSSRLDGKPVITAQAFDLLRQLLTLDPTRRITAESALTHEWFTPSSDMALSSASSVPSCLGDIPDLNANPILRGKALEEASQTKSHSDCEDWC